MNDKLTERRSIVAQTLGPHLSAADLDLSLELYDVDFATSEAFSSDEFCQCLNVLLPETSFTDASFSSLLGDLGTLASLTDNTATEAEATFAVVEDSDSSGNSASHDHPMSKATPMNHQHRPDSRRNPRQPVLLMGTYRHHDQTEKIPVVIEDLSRSGAGMLSFSPDQLASGDILQLQFGLEDSEQTLIETSVCVRWMQDNIFGAQFVHPEKLPQDFFDFLQVETKDSDNRAV